MNCKVNAYKELVSGLRWKGYTEQDISWVGTRDGDVFSIDQFLAVLKDTDYDSGYGTQELREDLIVAMNDGTWFERSEYDGSEWWSHWSVPAKGSNLCEFTSAYSQCYLAYFADEDEDDE